MTIKLTVIESIGNTITTEFTLEAEVNDTTLVIPLTDLFVKTHARIGQNEQVDVLGN